MSTNNCISNLLKVICLLQDNSTCNCNLEDGCAKPFLGPSINNTCYNTRVISLYKKDGTLFTTNYSTNNNENDLSSYFRIMNINNNCATLLILNNNNGTYNSTNQFITIDLKCICAIKCITDTNINNL